MIKKTVKSQRGAFKRQMGSAFEKWSQVTDLIGTDGFSAHIRIWVAYLLFNAGLFLPLLIFNVSEAVKIQLNMEVALLFALWAIWGRRWGERGLRRFATGFGVFYVFALLYKAYAGALSGLFQREANFLNDYSLVIGEMSFFLDAMNLPLSTYLASGTGIAVLIGLIFWGARKTFEAGPIPDPGKATRYGLITLGSIAILVVGMFPQLTADLQLPLSSVTAELTANIRRSLESQENIKNILQMDPNDSYDYSKYALSETPDVFFIFVESYGSVLYQRSHFTPPYLDILDAMETSLVDDGWSAVSSFSEAPTWGGGSWLSYTSALFGVLVDQQSEYNALKVKYTILEYPNLGRYFSSQGYEYTWVVTINRQLPDTREVVDQRFFGPDRWITFDTLGYEGPLFGWGPAAPDQFTLGFIQEFVSEREQPKFLVYLTQNSHYPWTPLPPILDNWRDFETIDLQDGVLSEAQKKGLSIGESRQNYLQAIENTLDSLEEFITSLEKENSVIVLIGDHQPATVSRHEDGYETMVHVISQDPDFLATFHEYGFVDGLALEDTSPSVRHEGLYSLFVRNFLARYGVSPGITPPYLPNGG